MKNGKYLEELRDIQSIAARIRKINEGIVFEDEFDDKPMQPEEGEMPEEPVEPETGLEASADVKDVKPEDEGMAELDKMGEVDQIREITLRGMIKLNKTPEDPQFQALLKIFQICNKAVETKDTEAQA